jgi:hypothetical protein
MYEVKLSAIGCTPEKFAAALEAHRAAVESHMMGKPGIPAPVAGELVVFLVQRIPDTGPVKERGPDKIVIAPYTIVDDTPLPPGQQLSLDTLPLYHASLDPAEYRSLLDRNGFDVVSHVVEDPDCGGHTIGSRSSFETLGQMPKAGRWRRFATMIRSRKRPISDRIS